MAGDESSVYRTQLRLFAAAALSGVGTARVEAAPRGRVYRAGQFSCEEGLFKNARGGVCLGDRVYEKARIRMHGCGVYIRCVPKLAQPAEEHHAHPVRDEAHDGEVMTYEKIGQRAFLLKLFKKIQYLVLHGDVQRGHRLITYDKLRPEGDGARDAYALALSAGKLVRVSVKKLARNVFSGSATISRTVMRGFSEAYGS